MTANANHVRHEHFLALRLYDRILAVFEPATRRLSRR
jgi:hypothetical protein